MLSIGLTAGGVLPKDQLGADRGHPRGGPCSRWVGAVTAATRPPVPPARGRPDWLADATADTAGHVRQPPARAALLPVVAYVLVVVRIVELALRR